jgi:hypothetical protein
MREMYCLTKQELEWWKDSCLEQTEIDTQVRTKLYAEVRRLRAEVERLEYIVDSIPDDVWEEMNTWEAMKEAHRIEEEQEE